jgi:serine/threonine protein kinase
MRSSGDEDAALPLAGRRFNFKRCLGIGGFGEVYLAAMTSSGGVLTEVAVKLLKEHLDPRAQAVRRLRDEARLLGLLNHPDLLRVHDLVVLGGRVALVMEYVDGADFDNCYTADPPLSVRGVVTVMGRVADALSAAWDRLGPDGQPLRLIHRDIKPGNIRIGRHGEVKLLDFGIAKATDTHREAKTQTDAIVGSLFYMAPERFGDEAIEPASDIFSLGATLYEALCRERLYEGVTVHQQYRLSFERDQYEAFVVDRLKALPVETSASVVDLLKRMLAYDPSARPTASELSRRCEDLGEEVGGMSLRRWCRKRKWPESQAMNGPMDGLTLTESSILSRDSVDGPAEATVGDLSGTLSGPHIRDQLERGPARSRRLRFALVALAAAVLMTVMAAALVAAVWVASGPFRDRDPTSGPPPAAIEQAVTPPAAQEPETPASDPLPDPSTEAEEGVADPPEPAPPTPPGVASPEPPVAPPILPTASPSAC